MSTPKSSVLFNFMNSGRLDRIPDDSGSDCIPDCFRHGCGGVSDGIAVVACGASGQGAFAVGASAMTKASARMRLPVGPHGEARW